MAKSRSAKVIILASGKTLTTLVGLISAAVLARLFSKLDYATYHQTMLAYAFAAPFAVLGLDRALYYFLPAEQDRPRGVLVENLLLLAAGGLLLSLFLVAGGSHLLARRFSNPGLAATLLILAPYPLLMLPTSSLGACLLARDRAGQVAVFNVASRLGMLLLVLIPCLLWPQPSIAITGVVVAAALSTMVALVLMFRACPAGDWRPTMRGLRGQLFYSVPLGLATLAGVIYRSLDKVMVSAMCTPESFAVYVNGAMEIPLIGIVTGSVTSVLIVEYTKLHRQGQTSEIVALIHRAMIKCALILIPAMVFLFSIAPQLMRFIFGAAYEDSAAPFRVYLLLLPMRTLSFGAILMATGNSRHVLIQSILALLSNAILTWYAIGVLGPVGAAAASVITGYFVAMPYLVVLLRRILKCPARCLFPWFQLLKIAIASAAGGLGALAVRQLVLAQADSLILLLTGLVYAAVTLLLFASFGLIDLSRLISGLRGHLVAPWRGVSR